MRRRTLSAPEEKGLRLGAWLPGALGLAAPEVEGLIRAGAVYVQGRRVTDPGRALTPGAKVSVVLEERGVSPLVPEAQVATLRVLFEDEDVLAVDKPAGVPAQATASRVGGSLLELATAHLQSARPEPVEVPGLPSARPEPVEGPSPTPVSPEPGPSAGLVHRLDRDTSGVTVFGKNARATAALAEQFREGVPRKRYLAVTGPGLPPHGHLDLPLSPDPAHKGRYRASRAANGKEAVTDFERLFGDEVFSLVLALPKTGRTHQIRAHLAAAGFPLAGDGLYRGPLRLDGEAIPRCLLHAQVLELNHPRTGAPLRLQALLPEDLRHWFDRAKVVPPA